MLNFLTEFFPEHEENKMKNEGNVLLAREQYYKYKPSNLVYLLKKRYSWMNKYISKEDKGIELGCGTGVAKDFIKNKSLILTDLIENPWVDKKVDAIATPFKDNELDYIICNNMIHHIAYPVIFFNEMNRVLKKGGRLIIQDIYTSLFMRIILFLMKHEGYSLKVNVFDASKPCNNINDPWSANCAISRLLFDHEKKFYDKVKGFKIIKKSYCEFFIFPLSGGVIAKAKTINLPFFILNILNLLDNILIFIFPKIFALQIRIVIEKV